MENININSEENKKVKLGQFFTKDSVWLKPQIIDFIKNSKCKVAFDPFAGDGDLLNAAKKILGFNTIKGLDIDSSLNWDENDSLISIPHINDAIIITNPPYIAKQSASKKKIDLTKYFNSSKYDDVYLIALDRMLEAQTYVVAIIPESFINSNYKKKDLINSITILEENPFTDTENPVCVVCFDGVPKPQSQIKVYKNDRFITNLEYISSIKLEPTNCIKISFNDLDGWLGLRAIDSSNDKTFINYDFKENFDYDWENNIKVSSRHFTLININIKVEKRSEFVNECNRILEKLRNDSSDIILTPFKGNTKKGKRRRRLDFRLARAIMEKAYKNINNIEKGKEYIQQKLF